MSLFSSLIAFAATPEDVSVLLRHLRRIELSFCSANVSFLQIHYGGRAYDT
jgi:hypothetical protein